MNNQSYFMKRHRQTQRAFFGLVALFAGVYGLILLGIFLEWQLFRYPSNASGFCSTFVKNHFWPLGIMLFLLALLSIMIWRGGMTFWSQYRNIQRLNKEIKANTLPLPAELDIICRNYQLTEKFLLTADEEPYAFVYGLLRPTIVISQGLSNILEKNELIAVLLHEKYHLVQYDPLKIMLGRAITQSLFFVPLAGKIHIGFNRVRELAADAMAIKLQGDNLGLALALRKLLTQDLSAPSELPTVGIIGSADLRITQLIHDGELVPVQIAPFHQVLLTLGIMVMLLIFFVSGCA